MFETSRERRRCARLDFCSPMRYRRISPDAQEYKGSLMKDISEGGVKMTTYEFLPLNLKLVMEIPLIAERKPMRGICRIAWVMKTAFGERYDVGVEFINLDQGDQAHIARFVFSENISDTKTN